MHIAPSILQSLLYSLSSCPPGSLPATVFCAVLPESFQYSKNAPQGGVFAPVPSEQAELNFANKRWSTLLNPDFVTQKFSKILDQYGLRHIRFHDLRHSCATIMLYLGYTMKDIQTWLGHSNYNFTANTYVHSRPDSHVEMASSFSEKLSEYVPVVDPSGGIY